jgi:hypothetical protein
MAASLGFKGLHRTREPDQGFERSTEISARMETCKQFTRFDRFQQDDLRADSLAVGADRNPFTWKRVRLCRRR